MHGIVQLKTAEYMDVQTALLVRYRFELLKINSTSLSMHAPRMIFSLNICHLYSIFGNHYMILGLVHTINLINLKTQL